MKQFEVGKTYETTVDCFHVEVGLRRAGQRFTCHQIDLDGDCWSMDVAWRGRRGKWCVAVRGSLELGDIVEVVE